GEPVGKVRHRHRRHPGLSVTGAPGIGGQARARPRCRYLSEEASAQPCLTADLRALPAENFGTRAAGMCTFSVGLRGFTPVRAARCWLENLPKPVKDTSPPLFNVSVIASRKASTALPASRAVSWLRLATS